MYNKTENLIRSLPFWKNEIKIKAIKGGLTNQNFLVQENSKKFFVRLGDDMPEHNVSRSKELIASNAAAEIGLSPAVIYNTKGVLVLEYIEGAMLSTDSIVDKLESIISLIKKIHSEMSKKLYGHSVNFGAFDAIKRYAKLLKNHKSSYTQLLPSLLFQVDKLEINTSPYDIVFCHNDLIFTNFLDDEDRLWIVDWEYSGFNNPLFDLGDFASHCNFPENKEIFLLENYFEKKINEKLLLEFNSFKCAAILREAMWSMVAELTSKIDFNFLIYTQEKLAKFNDAYNKLSLK